MYMGHGGNQYGQVPLEYFSSCGFTEHNTDHNIVGKLFPLIIPLHPGAANLLWAIIPTSWLH
jgi:hypothetical protein